MQIGSSGTLIGWKSGQTTFVPLWDRMEGPWLRNLGTLPPVQCTYTRIFILRLGTKNIQLIVLVLSVYVISA
jgi:hypothetical protein